MTNKRERLKLLAAVTRQFPELIQRPGKLGDRMAIAVPVRHIELQIRIDGMRSRDFFQLELFAWTLFDATIRLDSHTRDPLYRKASRPGANPRWQLSDPYLLEDLLVALERDVVSQIRGFRSLRDIAAFFGMNPGHDRWIRPEGRCLAALGLGDFALAKSFMDKWPWQSFIRDLNEQGDGLGQRIREQANELGKEDRALLAALFHRWEKANVEARGYSEFWQPTPFPFEEA